jgi:phosphatidylinositol glycan class O
MSASLALNAAQVWRYLTVYSATANKLPDLSQLEERLQLATRVYKDALADSQSPDNDKYVQASSLYKLFLTEALELGQRVWTRFDIVGMVLGIIVLSVGLILYMLPLLYGWIHQPSRLPLSQHWEVATAGLFMLYQCGLLTFSNSYILEEEDSVMYSLAVLSCVVALRLKSDPVKSTLWRDVLLLPLASRINELFVSGHGLDPSIRLHWAHSSVLFLTSLFSLGVFRWYLYQNCITQSKWHAIADCTTLFCLAISWWEKRSLNAERNGFASMRVALALLFIGVLVSLLQAVSKDSDPQRRDTHALVRHVDSDTISAFAKFLGAIMAVTGPSTSTSLVLYIFQVAVVYCLSVTSGPLQVHSVVLAALLRLVTRHVFFATNHGCTFSRLQVSAAFVATKEFYFATRYVALALQEELLPCVPYVLISSLLPVASSFS